MKEALELLAGICIIGLFVSISAFIQAGCASERVERFDRAFEEYTENVEGCLEYTEDINGCLAEYKSLLPSYPH